MLSTVSLLFLCGSCCLASAARQHLEEQKGETASGRMTIKKGETASGRMTIKKGETVQDSWADSWSMTDTFLVINSVGLALVTLVVAKVVFTSHPRSDTDASSEDKSISQALPSILLWCSLGIGLICFNKYMFMDAKEGGFGFPFPLALTCWHMTIAVIMTNILRVCRPDSMPAVRDQAFSFRDSLTTVVPIGVVFAAYLSIGNSAYLYLSVSFVQMLKSAGPIAVHVLACLSGVEKMQLSSIFTVCVICVGVAGASVGEIAFSWFGFMLQFTAFLLDAVRMVLLKKLVSSQKTNLDPLSGLYYYSPVCVLSLLGPVAYFEGADLIKEVGNAQWWFFAVLLLNGLIAFGLNATLLSLFKLASATTVSVASVVRDILLTFGSAWLFHTELTAVQVVGYLTACVGVKLWDHIKTNPLVFEKAVVDPVRYGFCPFNKPPSESQRPNEGSSLLPH